MNTNKSNGKKYTNEDFADALLELKEQSGLSYMQIAIKSELSDTYLVNIVKRKNLAPKDENIEKIAKALGVEPEYFFEYRLRRLVDFINENRKYLNEFLDHVEIKEKKIQKKRQASGM